MSAAPLPLGSLSTIPHQARSVERVHAILDAAIAVLLDDGAAGFNSNRVAARAGVSVGSVYQYFANKERMLAGIVERGVLSSETLLRAVADADPGVPMEQLIAAALHGLIDHLAPHRPLMRELFREAPLLVAPSVQTAMEQKIQEINRAWLSRRGDPGGRGAPAWQFVTVNAAIFLFLKWMIDPPPDVERAAFVAALTRMLCVDPPG